MYNVNEKRGEIKKLNERLKKLRKTLGLTQQEFADKIGSKRNTIAKYETNTNAPSAAVISLICREFDVNEIWLKTGEGEMFVSLTRDEEISRFVGETLSDESDTFKKRFISMLSNLDESDWEVLEKMVTLMQTQKKED